MATINQINESGKPWEYWKNVKRITDPQSIQKMELMEDGILIKDEQKLSNIMCKYFKTKIEEIESNIPEIDEDPIERLKKSLHGKNLKFSLQEVSEIHVEKAIQSLKNKSSSGIDFVSPIIIKMAVDILKIPLWFIINSSIQDG